MELVVVRLWLWNERNYFISVSVKQISKKTREAIESIASLASVWLDIDHPVRARAEEETLEAKNRFTQEALVFAINQQMSVLTTESLMAWACTLEGRGGKTVGVLNPGNIPFAGLQDFIGVILSGHNYIASSSSRSPILLPAFADELRASGHRLKARFADFDSVLHEADALIASGTSATMSAVERKASEYGIPGHRILLRGNKYSVAVIDDAGSSDEKEGLAEDMLLHEGLGCRNVALVWAPEGTDPDTYLDAMAAFRATFPSHPKSSAGLELQRAYLKAVDQSHAYADGLEFLLSKGTPDVQMPLHVRWVEYSDTKQVEQWLQAHRAELQLVVAPSRIALKIPGEVACVSPGNAQRPVLGWHQNGVDVAAFLRAL